MHSVNINYTLFFVETKHDEYEPCGVPAETKKEYNMEDFKANCSGKNGDFYYEMFDTGTEAHNSPHYLFKLPNQQKKELNYSSFIAIQAVNSWTIAYWKSLMT